MFKTLRALSGSIGELTSILAHIRALMAEHLVSTATTGNLLERVATLELSRARWEAEVEGVAMKASSTLKAARSAEERTRSMVGSANGADESDIQGEEEIRAAMEAYQLSLRDVEGSGEEEVSALHNAVETGSKEAAIAVKFGWQ